MNDDANMEFIEGKKFDFNSQNFESNPKNIIQKS